MPAVSDSFYVSVDGPCRAQFPCAESKSIMATKAFLNPEEFDLLLRSAALRRLPLANRQSVLRSATATTPLTCPVPDIATKLLVSEARRRVESRCAAALNKWVHSQD
jgi:hypothetical protein